MSATILDAFEYALTQGYAGTQAEFTELMSLALKYEKTTRKDLGRVTAYGYAKSKGYTGTEEEFAELMASYATVAEEAADSASEAEGYAEDSQEWSVESEAWATGQRNGVDVDSEDVAYHNNSKYYAEQAQDSADAAAESAATFTTDTGLTIAGKAADAKATGDRLAGIAAAVGSPLVITDPDDFDNASHTRVYVYAGTTTSLYTNGDWYYWDGDGWESGGVYNSVAVDTDDTLSVSGMAADAGAVGVVVGDVTDLKSAIDETTNVLTKINDHDYNIISQSYASDGYDSNRALTETGKEAVTGSVILSFPVTSGSFIKVDLTNRTDGEILFFFQDTKTVPWSDNSHIIGKIHKGNKYVGYLLVPDGATYLVTNTDASSIRSVIFNVISSKNDMFFNGVLPTIKVKQFVFNKYGIARDTGIPGSGTNRLHSPLSSCNEGDLVVVPNNYKFAFFYYNQNGYVGNSYDNTGGWYKTTAPFAIPFTGLFSIVLAKDDETDFTREECIALNGAVTLYSSKAVIVNGIEFGVGHIDISDQTDYYGLHGNDYYFADWSDQSTLCSTRWRTEERVNFVKGATIEVTTGYRFYIFQYRNNAVINGTWITDKYKFEENTIARILLDTTADTKTPYTEWPDLDTVIKIVNNKDIISQQDEIDDLQDEVDDLQAQLRYKELYIGELVSAHLTASGLNYTDWLVPYRISSKNVLALPSGDKRKLKITISDEYVFAIRLGATAENLSENFYWYHNGDEIAIPNGCNYYAISITRNNPGQYGDYAETTISPSEEENIGLKIYYSSDFDTVNANAEAEKILASARLFFSDSERNTKDKYAIIAHTSDCHGDYKRVENYYEYCDRMNVDVACVTGDIVSYRPSQGIGWFHEIVKNHQTLTAFCTGNHDVYNNDFTDDDIYTYMFSDVATEIGNTTGKTWYYKDIDAKKLRIISINLYQYGGSNRWYTHFTEEQLNWFASTLASTPTYYGVIVLAHAAQVSLDNAKDVQHGTFFQDVRLYNNTHNHVDGAPIYDIIDAFISKSTLSRTYTQTGSPSSVTVVADFSNLNSGVEFIAHLTGHFHQDTICYVPNTTNRQLMLNVVCTTSVYGGAEYPYLADISDLGRNALDSSQDAFNVYVIDRDNKNVKVIRVGQNKTYQMHDRKYMEIPYGDIT